MSEIKWSGIDVIKFLNIYRVYPCLWDLTSSDYPNRDAKKAAFQELLSKLEEIGLHTEEDILRKKIKSIRDTYRNELNKVRKSIKSGAVANEIYKPKLIWFAIADEFLNAMVLGRQSSSNLDMVCIGQDDAFPVETQLDVEDESSIPNEGVSSQKKSSCLYLCQSYPSSSTVTKQKRSGSPKDRHIELPSKTMRTNYPTRFEAATDKLQSVTENAPTEPVAIFPEEDQYVSFAKHIVSQLRELPMRSFIQLQSQIQQLITSERLNQLDNDQSTNLENIVSAQIVSPDSEIGSEVKSELHLLDTNGRLTILNLSSLPQNEV